MMRLHLFSFFSPFSMLRSFIFSVPSFAHIHRLTQHRHTVESKSDDRIETEKQCVRVVVYTKRIEMRLIILDTNNEVGEWAAKYVMKRINDFKPNADKYFVLGLPTGSTPLGMYRKLVEFYNEGRVSFKYVKTFNMDEYASMRKL